MTSEPNAPREKETTCPSSSERKHGNTEMKKSIMNCFFKEGTLMIPELANLTGYSVPTVSKYIHDSLDSGLVISSESLPEAKTRGRKATWYKLNPDAAYFLGIDTKHYATVLSVMDLAGNTIMERENADLPFSNTPQFLEALCHEIRDFIRQPSLKGRIKAACFNISGRVNARKGLSHSIFSFENSEDEPLAEIMSERIGVKSVIENDTRAMLYGELYKGGIRGLSDCLYVNISWGLGLGILANGEIYRGADDFAGEFGHTKAFDNEIICHCGKKGCLETEVSGSAAKRILSEQLAAGKTSSVNAGAASLDDLSVQDIIKAANNEDPLCQDIMEDMGRKLGMHLANLVNILNPRAIIIGGSMSKNNDLLLEAAKLSIKRHTLKLIHRNLIVTTSSNPERIGVIGACIIAREEFVRSMLTEN